MSGAVSISSWTPQTSLTHDGEVEGGLSEAEAVPQLDGVAAAVLLLTAADGQLTAAVAVRYGDVAGALLDLKQTHGSDHVCFVTLRLFLQESHYCE